MRLGLVLYRWPKSMPPGNIWIGKRQMVRKIKPHHMKQMEEDILREKQNIFYCMNPAATVEQERALYQHMDKEENPNDLYLKMMKVKAENTDMAPLPISNHYDILKTTGTWQSFDRKN